MGTFGGGTFGSAITSFDGSVYGWGEGPWGDLPWGSVVTTPLDVTYLMGSYVPALTVAGSHDVLTLTGTRASTLTLQGERAASVALAASAEPISLVGSNVPTLEKAGNP